MWSSEQGSTRAQPTTESPRPPRIGVVVTCTHDVQALRRCLAAVTDCCAEANAEMIVVCALSADEVRAVVREFPKVTYVTAGRKATVAELRRIGLLRASANILAFVDDFAVERHGWAAELCQSWRDWTTTGARIAAGSGRLATAIRRPSLSVVVPAWNGEATLRTALEGMVLSELPQHEWELVVVDDASTDATAAIAAEYADKLVRLPGRPHGPGYARNRGFEVTLGDCITFMNADVMVQPETLRRSVSTLMENPEIGAVFGCYDTKPLGRGIVSQYRNLLQHYYLKCNAGDASTFSSACGTVRSAVFQDAGGYDEWHFPRRQLEDLELGQRIRGLGHRIVLHTDILATNLKRWTLRRMIRTEIFDRAVPWMRLVNRHFSPPKLAGRTLRSIKKVNIVFTWLTLGLLLAAWWTHQPAFLLGSVVSAAVVIANDRRQLSFFRHERGTGFAVVAAGLGAIHYLAAGLGIAFGWIAKQAVGEPRPGPTVEAFTEMAVKGWPPVPAIRLMDRRLTATVAAPSTEVERPPHRRPTPPGLLALGNEGTT